MRRTDVGDVNLEAGMLADEDACGSRVVEVDVAEEEVADVLKGQAVGRETLFEVRDARGGAAVEERRTVRGVEEVARDDPLGTPVVEID
jgi:hypothetical protein